MKLFAFNRNIRLAAFGLLVMACGDDKQIPKAPPATSSKAANAEPSPPPAAMEGASRNPQFIGWIDDIDAGLALASAQDKPVILHFVADWCVPCVLFEKQVLGDTTVARELKERFVTVRLDVTESTPADEELQKRFEATTLPALLILGSDGEELTRVQSGPMPGVDEFLAQLSAIK